MDTLNMNESMDIGIVSFGAYIPRLRLQRSVIAGANAWFNPALRALGKGERAMANWDEDVVTMAVEAARECLGGLDRSGLTAVALASTTAPYADRQNAGLIKEALNLSDDTATLDYAGGQRAGTSALGQTLRAAGAGQTTLCVAAEKRRYRAGSEGELLSGDAAAAFLVGRGRPIARLLGSHSVSVDFVDHFRASASSFDYGWESRWVREEGYNKIVVGAIKSALESASLPSDRVDHLVIPTTLPGVASGIAKKMGIAPTAVRDSLGGTVGDSGVAHPLLMLASTLETARRGEHIVVSGFGQGCDVLVFVVTDAIETLPARDSVSRRIARGRPESNYLKYLAFSGLLELELGMRAEADLKQSLTALYRNRRTVLGLIGGRCRKTGKIQFPKTEIAVDASDHAVGQQEDYPLAEKTARVLTYTADHLTFTPDPPALYGTVEFEGGGRMLAEFTDAEPGTIAVGTRMRMMFRIKSTDARRGFNRYFWKAAPLSSGAEKIA
jgi:3-hydroxy-3-methylglutaryl CoA synthase